MAPKKPKSPKKAKDAGKSKAGGSVEPKPLSGDPGNYTWTSTKVEGGGEDSPPAETYSIAIELQNDKNKPVSTMPLGNPVNFRIKVGTETCEGQLDDKGKTTINGLPEKPCEVSFPEIHGEEWKKK